MEALTKEIMRMIDELQLMNDWQNAHPLDLDGKDSYGYKFESFNAYSTEPLSFTETAMKLETEARKVFKMVRILNRQSPLFMQMSGHLEKLVSQLGSACITKAVMEQRGENSSVMDNMLCTLTIDSLRGMTALNFRKCYDSYMESQTNYRVNPGALALSIRWSALDRRLLATQEKIELIKSGKLKVDTDCSANGDAPAKGDDTLSSGSAPEETPASADPHVGRESKSTPLSDKGRALPIDKTAIRGAVLQRKSNEPEGTVTPDNVSVEGDILRRQSSTPEGTVTHDNALAEGDILRRKSSKPEGTAAPDNALAEGDVLRRQSTEPERTPASAPPPEAETVPPDPYDDIGDEYDEYKDDWYDGDPDVLPYPSEDLVRRMSEYWQEHLTGVRSQV